MLKPITPDNKIIVNQVVFMKYIFIITTIHTRNTCTTPLYKFKLNHINNKLKTNKYLSAHIPQGKIANNH